MLYNLQKPTRRNYVQSPVDYIESFLWVTLWSLLQNKVEKAIGEIKWWAKEFEKGKRDIALREFRVPTIDEDACRNVITERAIFSEILTARCGITI